MKHLDILRGLPQTAIQLHQQFPSRQSIIEQLYKQIWPSHYPVWVENIEQQITKVYSTISKRSGPFIVINVEEDTLIFDPNQVRRVISQHPNWTKDSMFLTNSRIVLQECDNDLRQNLLLRPCLLDLISYAPYDTSLFEPNLDIVSHHTGFMYRTVRTERKLLIDYIKQNNLENWLSIVKYDDILINNTNMATQDLLTDGFVFKDQHTRVVDCPYQEIQTDRWMQHSAFVTVIECYYKSHYAPTLSEKTFKAMHHFRPALIHGGAGTQSHLQYLGFDTWDWLIDWSFDTIADHDQRFQGYLSELHRLMSMPLPQIRELMENNKDSLLHNKQHIEHLITNYSRLPWDDV